MSLGRALHTALMGALISSIPVSAIGSIGSGLGVASGGGAEFGEESFKTELATGAFTLSIPIVTPRGVNGFQPEAVLHYHSQRGVTWVGRGWDLQFGVIQRMIKFGTPEYDDDPGVVDLDPADVFALDDDRLVRDDSGIYHTGLESFQRIQRVPATGDILHWVVHRTDGTTMWFGRQSDDPNSVVVGPVSGRILRWHLTRAEDRNGNFIDYRYQTPGDQTPTGSSGIRYPTSVTYGQKGGGGILRRLIFTVGPRADVSIVWEGGVKVRVAHRLESIRVEHAGGLVTRYRLDYLDEVGQTPPNGRSLLHQVVRIGADDSEQLSHVLPGDKFEYSGVSVPSWGTTGTKATKIGDRLGNLDGSALDFYTGNWGFVDVNADAVPDVVYTNDDVDPTPDPEARVWINHRTIAQVGSQQVDYFPPESNSDKPIFNIPWFADGETLHLHVRWNRWADYNGDGRVDLVFDRRNVTSGSERKAVYRNNGANWTAETDGYATPPMEPYLYRSDCGDPYPWRPFGFSYFIDVNGDGLADVVHQRSNSTDCTAGQALVNWTVAEVYLNNGNGWAAQKHGEWSAALGLALEALNVRIDKVVFFDLNGDGLVDMGADEGGGGAIDGTAVQVNNGRGWESAVDAGFAFPSELIPVDLDGDGLVDHAGFDGTAKLNAGSSFSTAAFSAPTATPVGDLDGDGRSDFVLAFFGSVSAVHLSSEGTTPERPAGLLVRIHRSSGGIVDVGYQATTEGSCYDADEYDGCNATTVEIGPAGAYCTAPLILAEDGSSCVLPLETLSVQFQTVRTTTISDQNGNVRTDLSSYQGGLFVPSDREFRGFQVVSQESEAGIVEDPRSGVPRLFIPFRQTFFYGQRFLKGKPAWTESWGYDPTLEGLVPFFHHRFQYGVTRGDGNGSAWVIGMGALCDLDDPNQVEEEPEPGECELENLESGQYSQAAGQIDVPHDLPYAGFRAAFGAQNPDAERAYLVLPVGDSLHLMDGLTDLADPNVVILLNTRWHDTHGNVQAELRSGSIDDPGDDRLTVTAFASPIADPNDPGPINLSSLPRWTEQRAGTSMVLERSAQDYDGLPNGDVRRGNVTEIRVGTSAADPNPATTRFTYPSDAANFGLPATATDRFFSETPRVATITYDAANAFVFRRSRGVVPAALQETTLYDPNGAPPGMGVVASVADPSGGTINFVADRFGRVTSRSGPLPLGETETRSYLDTFGVQLTQPRVTITRRDGAGNNVVTEQFEDGLGRMIRVERNGLDAADSPATVVEQTFYDRYGRLRSSVRPYIGQTAPPAVRMVYDEIGRLRYRIEPVDLGPSAEAFSETVYQRLETRTFDGATRRVDRLRNGQSELVAVAQYSEAGLTPPLLSKETTSYLYDPLGRLRAVCEAGASSCPTLTCSQCGCSVDGGDARHSVRLSYNALGHRVRIDDPDLGTWLHQYDGRGNVLTQTDARANGAQGSTLTFQYDPVFGRIQCEQSTGAGCAGADTVYTYGDELGEEAPLNSRGRLVTVANPDVTTAYDYDGAGRVTKRRILIPDHPAYEVRGEYDWLDRPTSIRYPDGENVRRTYDLMGTDRVFSESPPREYVANATHDAVGNLRSMVHGTSPNATTVQFTYESRSGLLDTQLHTVAGAGGPLMERGYNYDPTGKITSISVLAGGSESMSAVVYDGIGRLRSAVRGASENLTYNYDVLGNLIDNDGVTQLYQYPGRLPHAHYETANPTRFQYDLNGNLTFRDGKLLSYDQRNRLASVATVGDSRTVTFAYDHEGTRVLRRHGGDKSVFLGPDYEIQNQVRFIKTIRMEGRVVAQVAVVLPGGPIASLGPSRAQAELWMFLVGAGPASLALGWLLWLLVARWRAGLPIPQAAFAGGAAILLYLAPVTTALAAIPDGDVNSDSRLDSADALLLSRIAADGLVPSAEQETRGDIAPLENSPDGRLNSADLVLLLRAVQGEDVDGDGLTAAQELEAGASPFRVDSDRDGIDDVDEIDEGLLPGDVDSDNDGIADNEDDTPLSPTPGSIHWIHSDQLGGTAVQTDASAAVVRNLRYGVWGDLRANQLQPGAPASTPDPEEKFTSQRRDPGSGLYHYGARYYDADFAHFTQPDSIVPDWTDPQALNRFAYVRNDPLNRVDPSGNLDFTLTGASAFGGYVDESGGFTGFQVGYSWRGGYSTYQARAYVQSAPVAAFRIGSVGAQTTGSAQLFGGVFGQISTPSSPAESYGPHPPAGPGTVFGTPEEAAIAGLYYSRFRSYVEGNPELERGGPALRVKGGFTFNEPAVQKPGDEGVVYDQPDDSPTDFHTHTRSGDARRDASNEIISRKDATNIFSDQQRRPSYLLSPSDAIRVFQRNASGIGISCRTIRGPTRDGC